MKSEDIARVCHEANRAYCESIGDNTQVSWDEIPESKRKTTISGVENQLQNPDLTAADSHESWMIDKLVAGWKYGPERNDEKKEHPDLVAFEQMPREQQIKDTLFIAIVKVLSGD